MDIGKIEYRVRPVTRFIVTRYEEGPGPDAKGMVSVCGEYDNGEVAHEVAYALCKTEHDRLGLPPGDARIQYPVSPTSPRHLPGENGLLSAAALSAVGDALNEPRPKPAHPDKTLTA